MDADNERSYTTTTTTTTKTFAAVPIVVSETREVGAGPAINLNYVKTLEGIIKCVAILLAFLCLICVVAGGPGHFAGAGWATFVTITAILVSTFLLCMYIFRIIDQLTQVPWNVGEMVYCFAMTIFFFIAGCVLAVAAARFHGAVGWGFAAFFAFGAMCTFGFDCYLKFLAWKNDGATR